MNDFDESRQIAVIWDIEDVHSLGYNLTDEQALDVLQFNHKNHDAELGINWNTLESWINYLYPDCEKAKE